jgi:tRNA threonylcarbamoyladenosine biosynthesis protein TsaE
VLHLDLYRLESPGELAALGLADYLPGSRLWLIEWPQKAQGEGLPAPDLHLHLEPLGMARRALIEPGSPQGTRWAAAAAADSG